MYKILDGKETAKLLRAEFANRVSELKEKHGRAPGLAVIIVGEDPASKVYVRNKKLLLAHRKMRHGKKPTEIYLECGFSSYPSFYRAYIAYFGKKPKSPLLKKIQFLYQLSTKL